MPIEFDCPVCKNAIRVPDGSQGKRTRCPKCQAVMQIPGGQEETFAEGPTFSDRQESPAPRNEPWSDSQNPFGSPAAAQAPRVGGDLKRNAKQRLGVPAVVCTVLVGITLAFSILYYLFLAVIFLAGIAGEVGEMLPDNPAELIGNIVGGMFSIIMMVIALIGLNGARKVENSGLAWTGFILAALPCTTSACCIFSLPFAIWGMVVLADSDVKRAFKI